jgi:hypothetical protein
MEILEINKKAKPVTKDDLEDREELKGDPLWSYWIAGGKLEGKYGNGKWFQFPSKSQFTIEQRKSIKTTWFQDLTGERLLRKALV